MRLLQISCPSARAGHSPVVVSLANRSHACAVLVRSLSGESVRSLVPCSQVKDLQARCGKCLTACRLWMVDKVADLDRSRCVIKRAGHRQTDGESCHFFLLRLIHHIDRVVKSLCPRCQGELRNKCPTRASGIRAYFGYLRTCLRLDLLPGPCHIEVRLPSWFPSNQECSVGASKLGGSHIANIFYSEIIPSELCHRQNTPQRTIKGQ